MKIGFFKEMIKRPQFYKFLSVSIAINLAALFFIAVLTSSLGIFYAYSVLISLEVFAITSFFIHDKWTFGNVPKRTKKHNRFIKFNLFALLGFGLNEAILLFLTNQMGMFYLFSESIAIVITFFFNFIINNKITWKN